MASRGHKSCLPLVEVESAAEVQLGEDGGSVEMFKCRWNEGKWITEFNRYFVERPVINTRPQASVLFGREEETRSSRGR